MRRFTAVCLIALAALFLPFPAQAQEAPQAIKLQGYLTDDTGVPIDASVPMVFCSPNTPVDADGSAIVTS